MQNAVFFWWDTANISAEVFAFLFSSLLKLTLVDTMHGFWVLFLLCWKVSFMCTFCDKTPIKLKDGKTTHDILWSTVSCKYRLIYVKPTASGKFQEMLELMGFQLIQSVQQPDITESEIDIARGQKFSGHLTWISSARIQSVPPVSTHYSITFVCCFFADGPQRPVPQPPMQFFNTFPSTKPQFKQSSLPPKGTPDAYTERFVELLTAPLIIYYFTYNSASLFLILFCERKLEANIRM